MKNWLRRTVLTITGITALAAIASPAGAAGNTQFSGTGVLDANGDCTEIASPFPAIKMSGDLVGCWYTTTYEVVQETPSGVYMERGTETFIGCLADGTTCGTFSTTYKYTAKFAPDGAQMHGRCQHPIVPGSGTGDFEGISGRVDFKDDIENKVFNYRGHFKLN